MAYGKIINVLGLTVSGDFGPLTIYTSRRHKKVAFPKSPPLDPPSALQSIMRAAMRRIMNQWAGLPPPDKRAYATACRRCKLCMNAQALFYGLACPGREQLRRTLERQARVTLQPPV